MSMEGLVAALYGVHEGTAASAILAAYKCLQKPALKAAAGQIDLAELDSVLTYLVNARERLGGVAGSDYQPCRERSAPSDGNIRCIRLDNHGGDHWFAMAWDGTGPARSMVPIRVTAEELGVTERTAQRWAAGQDGQTSVNPEAQATLEEDAHQHHQRTGHWPNFGCCVTAEERAAAFPELDPARENEQDMIQAPPPYSP